MSVTVFRQSTILDRFTADELKQVCFALDYHEVIHDWNQLRSVVGNLLLDKNVRVFKDQGGIIQIINKDG